MLEPTFTDDNMTSYIGLILLLLALVIHPPAAAQDKVIVGHSARAALSIGPLLYGIERGFYRDEGIDAVYVSLRADLGIKALLSGDIDYSYSVGTIIRGAILGVPVCNLTFDFSRVLHTLMSRPEIPNAAALRGKRVGVSSFGATGDLAARVGLRSLGLDPEKDVTISPWAPTRCATPPCWRERCKRPICRCRSISSSRKKAIMNWSSLGKSFSVRSPAAPPAR